MKVMTSNDAPEQEIERTLQSHFEAERARLRAPADLWERIEGRLEEPVGLGETPSAWRRIFTPRQLGVASALAAVIVVLFASSGAWLFFTGGAGQVRVPTMVSKRTTAAVAAVPAATMAPAAGEQVRQLQGVRGLAGAAGSAGAAGPAGATGRDSRTVIGENLSSGSVRNQGRDDTLVRQVQAASVPTPVPAASAAGTSATPPTVLETAQRHVISQASVSVDVDEVSEAVAQVRAIAEGLGGFVEQLSSSGGPDRQRATMTIRVPQPDFFAALEQIKSLGMVRSEDVGSEDVTERFIDLEARLRSSAREEESLLSLLERAGTVSDVLSIERELSRVRSDIERDQGRLNFLSRRVDLATINVTLAPPGLETGESPSAMLTVLSSDVNVSVGSVKSLIAGLDGEIDRVLLTGGGTGQAAELSLRVFAADFAQALAAIEREGDVLEREVREGSNPKGSQVSVSEDPDARISLSIRRRAPPDPPSANVTIVVTDVPGSVEDLKQRVSTLGGVTDQSDISVREDRDSAFLSLRVYRSDFTPLLASIEGQGKLRSKLLRQAADAADGDAADPQEPDSVIDVNFLEEGGPSETGLILAVIGAGAGGVILVALVGFLFFAVYRAGRRRSLD